jgi:sulfite reductase (NADPH) flavoprotein alpha-component
MKSVRFPGKGGKVVAVYFRALNTGNGRATDHVWVDACSARVLKEKGARTEAAGSQFFSSLLWIHTGQWLGIVGRVLALLVALTIAGLGITGLIQWLVREARTRRNRAARKAKAQGVLASEPQGPASAG